MTARPSSPSDPLVLVLEAEAIDLLLEEELGVTNFLDPHPPEHLTDDHFDVLVVDVHALQSIDLLDRVDQVSLQLLHSADRKDIVRIERTVHQRFAGANTIAFLNVDVRTTRISSTHVPRRCRR